MSWFSILPANLTVIETWIIRFFLLLGIMTIGPWALFLIYDVLLYIIRAVAYEIPYFGGRARGRGRPRAPSLKERPNGRRRTFSISGPSSGFVVGDENDKAGLKRRGLDGGVRDEAGANSEDDEAVDITAEESHMIRSADLWDARTDSRFVAWNDTSKKKP
ncbi:hypothetical protein HO173_002901 [Letharia columbiana]|uniref:Uncharacterized protein n=1 Tax=Letharia columbiana TaxID=112416 RepID=A0A8H6G265_9LECA|nr:uncharacterized protein HO173_002901 [Letharia columbiana]KAF6239029.1 hypothetical protein HO173_002901 [Letharia columbiana]